MPQSGGFCNDRDGTQCHRGLAGMVVATRNRTVDSLQGVREDS
jgi:hypothetical protein